MCWYVLSLAGYLLYIFSSRCESVPSEKTLSMYKSENLICFFFCTYISSRCESWIQTPRSRKKNLKHEWTYVNFYSHILWKSNDTKFLFIAVNTCWQKNVHELKKMELNKKNFCGGLAGGNSSWTPKKNSPTNFNNSTRWSLSFSFEFLWLLQTR